MEETFPDTLDLLVVCVEAGLGTDAALLRVAEEQASHGLAIGHELLLACRESHGDNLDVAAEVATLDDLRDDSVA